MFEEHVQILRWNDEITLNANGMNGVGRDGFRGKGRDLSFRRCSLPAIGHTQSSRVGKVFFGSVGTFVGGVYGFLHPLSGVSLYPS